jgi:hypothetical protein
VTADHPDAVIALGAGHSHYEDSTYFDAVREALQTCRVVLLLPYSDMQHSIEVLRGRCVATKGHDWTINGYDFLSGWVTSEQNRTLADCVAYSLDVAVTEYSPIVISELERVRSDVWGDPTWCSRR